MNNSKLLELVLQSFPYPEQLANIDVTSEPDAIRFDWRFSRYRASKHLSVEVVEKGCLVSNDVAILVSQLLKKCNVLRSL